MPLPSHMYVVLPIARCALRSTPRGSGFGRTTAEDRQDADAFRVLFYTGIRVGELLTLRWADVDLAERLMLVRRNLSAGVETEPKGRRYRYVPLSDPALGAFPRLGNRNEFVGPDDYVVCNR